MQIFYKIITGAVRTVVDSGENVVRLGPFKELIDKLEYIIKEKSLND